ncbi:MAG TPA: selenocysteine-specific translation elongation factor, partial [Tepidisphaeraceae bacterium]|nr:selenocysteine-specific translation elongation factor [Tepidisphaeraceae bacterium]
MSTTHYILATAGHVDHGKSALVTALTGMDPDRLPEEKSRGITIELGFAHFDLPSLPSADAAATYRVGLVDVPGHEDFVKNMVAGVGSIDLALLVVAADDGWMPQTEEHLQILSYAGVRRAVVALTKIDLVASDENAREQLRQKLAGTALAGAPIVSTSVVKQLGIGDLKLAIANELSRTLPQPDIGKPRLSVDRAFSLRGAGTVVTGTLTGGSLRRGDAVVLQPGATSARVRTIQSYNRDVEQATPGSRVALNLPDLHPGSSAQTAAAVGRGDVITHADLGRSSDTFDAVVEMSSRTPNARPLKEATRVRVHHGSGNFPATVYLLGGPVLLPGER